MTGATLAPLDERVVESLGFAGVHWLIIPLLLAAAVLAGSAVWTHRRERQNERKQKTVIDQPTDVRYLPSGSRKSHQPSQSAVVASLMALDFDNPEQSIVPLALLKQIGTTVCETCEREFRTTLDHCPFDNGTLVSKDNPSSDAVARDVVDTSRTVMRCSSCQTGFDLGANYCIYDGEPLSQVDDHVSTDWEDSEMVCPECEAQFEADTYFCPEDGARLLPSQSDQHGSSFGAIPLVICPDCLSEYPATETSCLLDGTELLPLIGRTTGATPASGIGCKQRFCPDCGGQFAADAEYCSLDGTQLTRMS